MLRPMKLEGALKLYIALYVLAFSLTFFTSVPMLYHVSGQGSCLLFSSPPPITYGSSAGCIMSGILPIVVAISAFGLGFVNWLHLRKTQEHIKLPEMTSDEFRLQFKKKFWRIIIAHSVVVGIIAVNAIILTAGYTTACQNIYQDIQTRLRARIQHTPSQNRGTNTQQQNHEVFADDFTITRYNNDNLDVLGQNRFERAITCRTIFTDHKNHYDLKKNSFKNQYLQTIYGFWNDNDKYKDVGDFRHIASRDNMILELSLAGAWIGLFVWGLMLALMVKERHHLKAFLTDESMWGGSDYGGSVRSGRSRKSQQARMMSPIDFENIEKMSHHSKMSNDRASHISRASRSSRGTSYKDMAGARKQHLSNSYKSMNGKGSTGPSQLTVSRLEKMLIGGNLDYNHYNIGQQSSLMGMVPEVESDYQVNRLLHGTPRQHQIDADSLADTSAMTVGTVTGTVIGPGSAQEQIRRNNGGRGPGGLMDYFGGGGTPTPGGQPISTEESDIM